MEENLAQHTPTLSIVMPFFNQKELVVEAIESIAANDFKEWELLAIDDGSTEDTWTALSEIAQKDNRIHLLHRDHLPKGAQACRNMGLEKAKGEYIVFFDSDDYIAPHCLGQRVSLLSKRTDLDFLVFPSGNFLQGKFNALPIEAAYGYPTAQDVIAAFARRDLPFIVWNNIYRTASIRKFHLTWDENLKSLQDADFNMQAILAGLHFDFAHTYPDYGYRIAYSTTNLSSKTRTEEHKKSHLYSFSKMYSSIQKEYGSKYNKDLFLGILRLYNFFFTNGVDHTFAVQIAQTIGRYSHWHASILRTVTNTAKFLEHILPAKRARQIPLIPYLLYEQLQKTRRERKLIRLRNSYKEYNQQP